MNERVYINGRLHRAGMNLARGRDVTSIVVVDRAGIPVEIRDVDLIRKGLRLIRRADARALKGGAS